MHSFCAKCHETLRKEGKACPVCQEPLLDKRNLCLEKVVEAMPNKICCKIEGCHFKKARLEA